MKTSIGASPARRLRVLHALGWYFPESSGGTEVYVEGLTRHLSACGIDSRIVAAAGDRAADYVWGEVPVHRYPVPEATDEEVASARPHDGFAAFDSWLRAQDLDIYHQHSWTRGCGMAHLKLAKQLGLRTIVTVHVPSVVCLRGTMMLDGTGPCDGEVDVARCTRCWGPSRGIPPIVADWQGRYPGASAGLARAVPASRLRTALLTPTLVANRQADLADLATLADRVVAVCRWLYDALIVNGFPSNKLVYCPQGIDIAPDIQPLRHNPRTDAPLRVGFLGRWDRVKGVHTLVDAFKRLAPDVRAELVVHGLPGDAGYEQMVRGMAAGDRRIRIAGPVGRADVATVLAGFDVLAVPSLWMETGPLVMLEASAAGIPVLGSDLGGIVELVEAGVAGRLLPAGDVDAWSRALAELAATQPAHRFPQAARRPRSTRQIAEDMSAMYHEVVGVESVRLSALRR